MVKELENKIKQEILDQWETLELGMKLKETQLENKLNRLETALNILIIITIVESIVFVIPMYISLITKGF